MNEKCKEVEAVLANMYSLIGRIDKMALLIPSGCPDRIIKIRRDSHSIADNIENILAECIL